MKTDLLQQLQEYNAMMRAKVLDAELNENLNKKRIELLGALGEQEQTDRTRIEVLSLHSKAETMLLKFIAEQLVEIKYLLRKHDVNKE